MPSNHNPDVHSTRPKPRPHKQDPGSSRDSSAIRASVLDAALQLGLGSSSLVADWMFNNPLKEEDEDQIPSPGLTHSEESPASSPLSGRYPPTPSSSSQNHSNVYTLNNFHLQHANTVPFMLSSESSSLIPHLPSSAADSAPPSSITLIQPRPLTPSRLKKKRVAGRDGYESDGVVRNDGGRRKEKKKDKKDEEKNAKNGTIEPGMTVPLVPGSGVSLLTVPDQESLAPGSAEEPRRRKRSLVKAPPKPKFHLSAPTSPLDQVGYDIDGFGKKSKSKGWMSGKKAAVDDKEKDLKKAKSLFFRLGNKVSRSDLKSEKEEEEEKKEQDKKEEKFALPIAERFATTLNLSSVSTNTSLTSSGNAPPRSRNVQGEGRLPVVGGSVGLGLDLGLGLSGDMFTTSSTTAPSTQTTSPTLSIPSAQGHPSQSTPPTSFPLISDATNNSTARPGSAGTNISMGTMGRTSTSTNTHPQSGITNSSVSRTSFATSISTSQSHSHLPSAGPSLVSLKNVASRESSNDGNSNLGLPQTPSKRRVLPFLGGGSGVGIGTNSVLSGDGSGKGKEKGKKREEKEREKERKKEKEWEKAAKKPVISLPMTRIEAGDPREVSGQQIMPDTAYGLGTLSRPRPINPPINGPFGARTPAPHPPVSNRLLQQQGGLSRQTSMPTLQVDSNATVNTNAQTSPPPGRRSPSPASFGGASAMQSGRPVPMTITVSGNLGVGPASGRHSPLPAPNALAYYDMPPPSPPPLSPLPNLPPGAGNVNMGVAVTTGSPLPSPLLVSSPSSSVNSSPNLGAGAGTGVGMGVISTGPPPPSFSSSSISAAAVAGSVLRARVQRRLSQQEQKGELGIGTGVVTSIGGASIAAANGKFSHGNLSVPTVNVQRGRESPFPINPIHSNNQMKHHTQASNNFTGGQGPSPRSGWMDDVEDDEGLFDVDEGVRSVLARFRESRIEYGEMRMEEEKEAAQGVIATRRSFEALRGADTAVSHSNDLPGPGPVGKDRAGGNNGSGGYDSLAIEEYYGRGDGRVGATNGEMHNEQQGYEDDGEESYYPEDEIHNPAQDHKARRRRSTLYLEDEEADGSSSGHGHERKNGRASRWSGSIYSRASFLDTEKSGAARERFVKRVEAMLDERDRVPPVPKLPQEFMTGFKGGPGSGEMREEDGEYVFQRTIGVGARKVPAGSGGWNRF